MAERRMFAKTIIDSDAFLDMPISARLLYYDLSMRADDDGFVNCPKKIIKMIGASQDDLSILAMRKFIIPFDSGIVVIKHWKIHNYIAKDRYKETKYKEEKSLLALDENNSYTMVDNVGEHIVHTLDTQVRLGKDSIDKDNIEKENIKRKSEKDNFEEIIDDYTNNPELKDAINEFIKMRKSIKKPLTENALKRTLNKLDQLSNDELVQIKILQQSVDYCWQGVFELQDNKNNKQKRNGMDDFRKIWEDMKNDD